MKKIFITAFSILSVHAVMAQNNTKLKRELFERDMIGAEKMLSKQLEKGDSTQIADYAYILKRLHQNEKAFQMYQIADRQGKLTDVTTMADYLTLSKQFNKNASTYNSSLKQLGYAEGKTERNYTKLAVIENACFNSSADDIACALHEGNILLSSTRSTVKNNIENSLLKSFSVNEKCEVTPLTKSSKLPVEDNKNHVGPIHAVGNYLFITRSYAKPNKQGIFNLEIQFAVKGANGYGAYMPLPVNNVSYSVQHPYFDASTNTLYFSSNMPNGKGGFDLYKMDLNTTTNTWSNALPVNEVNTTADEVFPTVGEYGNLYYSTTTINGLGGLDIYCLNKGTANSFMLSAPVNSAFDDFYYHINKQLKGYLTSNRNGGKGGDDVYTFSIDTTPYKVCVQLNDSLNKRAINQAAVNITYGSNTYKTESDNSGKVCVTISALDYNPATPIQIEANKPGFKPLKLTAKPSFNANREMSESVVLAPIPAPVPVAKIKVGQDLGKLLNLNPIYFDLGKWDVRPDAALELDKIVNAMREFPTLVIELGSHTDSRSSAKFNQTLSQKRAEASGKYILSQGIDPKRLTWKGYGESKLLNKCKDGVKCSEEDHSKNRRTEFKIIKM